jgi:hypothetical protein
MLIRLEVSLLGVVEAKDGPNPGIDSPEARLAAAKRVEKALQIALNSRDFTRNFTTWISVRGPKVKATGEDSAG